MRPLHEPTHLYAPLCAMTFLNEDFTCPYMPPTCPYTPLRMPYVPLCAMTFLH